MQFDTTEEQGDEILWGIDKMVMHILDYYEISNCIKNIREKNHTKRNKKITLKHGIK